MNSCCAEPREDAVSRTELMPPLRPNTVGRRGAAAEETLEPVISADVEVTALVQPPLADSADEFKSILKDDTEDGAIAPLVVATDCKFIAALDVAAVFDVAASTTPLGKSFKVKGEQTKIAQT